MIKNSIKILFSKHFIFKFDANNCYSLEKFTFNYNKTLIIKSIARHSAKMWQGLGHVIGNILYRNAKKNGFTKIIHAFMRENGYSTQISKNYSGEIYKNYALYGKSLSN
ncbi:MAG: hypothetical protein EAZ20_00225 [Bacteroidetes bacterium]|nr:MAG: hypothetical protein EAZ20_00225 [Bacteroidota bacterium]